jgi:hypothetical protein
MTKFQPRWRIVAPAAGSCKPCGAVGRRPSRGTAAHGRGDRIVASPEVLVLAILLDNAIRANVATARAARCGLDQDPIRAFRKLMNRGAAIRR